MLSDDVDQLLGAYRAELDQRVPDGGRAWSKLERKIASEASSPVQRNDGRLRWVVVIAVGLAAAMLLAWGAARLVSVATTAEADATGSIAVDVIDVDEGQDAQQTAGTIPTLITVVPDERPVSSGLEVDDAAEPPGLDTPVEGPVDNPPPRPRSSRKKDLPSSDVVAEAKSLRGIRLAVRDGKGSAALSLVRKHRRRFSSGMLRNEVDLLEAEAACLAGRRERAKALVARLIARAPQSPLVTRAEKICAGS